MSTAVLEAPGRDLADDRLFDEDFDLPKGFEFVDGELREKIMSYLSSYVACTISTILRQNVISRDIGWVASEGTSFRCFPHDVRKTRRADTAFHTLDRLTKEQATTEGLCTVVPDLVVEVVSPHDTHYEVEDKRFEWLEAGVKLVWIVTPEENPHGLSPGHAVSGIRRRVHPHRRTGAARVRSAVGGTVPIA